MVERETVFKNEYLEVTKEVRYFDPNFPKIPGYRTEMVTYHLFSNGRRVMISPDELEALAEVYKKEIAG
ncbi:hypothetical protein SAMN02745671_01007 [Anaerovibrio lipolyticus DSM 3074]|uniref:Uncharacterized protein n=1 Tax=Anaerovibrio lipolyticus DSM 3074 TaxID=1120997 RepID=A0A1M6C589_9FIRM|nr:hypothetical protein [Anaerovibrio lipolyticus]SHI56186.1 hypothetical protein SAMN02745671_01007 [Anaerovibrio lipolyticus DSM 3074]